VDEAYNLLNKSIIRVEQPDVNLDDEEDDLLLSRIPEADGSFNIFYFSRINYINLNNFMFRNGC